MGRRRRLTRRQRALCWCLALALVAGLGGLQYRYLSYWRPVHEAEERGGIGKTVWLMNVPPEKYKSTQRRMLRGNDRALMAVTVDSLGFPYGWRAYDPAYLDCTPDRALHAAIHNLNWTFQDDKEIIDVECFGRVEDPTGGKVRVEVFWRPDPATEQGGGRELATVEIPRLEWVEKDGLVCFERQFSIPLADRRGVRSGELWARFTLTDWTGEELENWERVLEWYTIGSEIYY